MAVITLLSDFGLVDPYVAQMKAVILSIVPQAEIVDISHGVEKYNIASGSYLLETTLPFFPTGSIHVAVVDPGVGGPRLPIAIDCDHGTLIGPDNGLLARAADRLGFRAAHKITSGQFIRDGLSATFHGRDIFAFTAGKIAQGHKLSEVGPPLAVITRLDLPDPGFSTNSVTCSVLYVDSFGSLVTNISETDSKQFKFRDSMHIKILVGNGENQYDGLTVESYSDIPIGRLGLLRGSQGYLEIALREASAAARLRVKSLDSLEIRFS
jgi:S-adenosyl-L-methionine hydrolase (adenosine-forming)